MLPSPSRRVHARLLAAALAVAVAPIGAQTPAPPRPPVAERVPKIDTLHGETRTDDYFWMKRKTDPISDPS